MIELFKRNRILISATGALLLLIIILTIRWRESARIRIIDESVQGISYPIQTAFSNAVNAISDMFDNYLFLVRLNEENDRLKLQIQTLEEELNHHINSSIQFNLLREQLKFQEINPEKKVFAEVIGESVDNFHHTLLINKGHLANINRNYPVVLREGVVGRIQSSTAFQAVVQLIVDRRHRFPVIIQRSRERMILRGSGGALRLMAPDRGIVFGMGEGLKMNRIRMLADVQVGDRVITSGLAGIFPKGLLVGIATKVERERHELFQTAQIEPVVDFNKIEGVYIIINDNDNDQQPFFSKQ